MIGDGRWETIKDLKGTTASSKKLKCQIIPFGD
jgi:hypothetical protein